MFSEVLDYTRRDSLYDERTLLRDTNLSVHSLRVHLQTCSNGEDLVHVLRLNHFPVHRSSLWTTRYLICLTKRVSLHQLVDTCRMISVSGNGFDSSWVRRDTTCLTWWETRHFRIRFLQRMQSPERSYEDASIESSSYETISSQISRRIIFDILKTCQRSFTYHMDILSTILKTPESLLQYLSRESMSYTF